MLLALLHGSRFRSLLARLGGDESVEPADIERERLEIGGWRVVGSERGADLSLMKGMPAAANLSDDTTTGGEGEGGGTIAAVAAGIGVGAAAGKAAGGGAAAADGAGLGTLVGAATFDGAKVSSLVK